LCGGWFVTEHEDVDEGRDRRGYRHGRDHREASEQDPDDGDGDERDEWREPDGLHGNAGVDDVVLEPANRRQPEGSIDRTSYWLISGFIRTKPPLCAVVSMNSARFEREIRMPDPREIGPAW